MTRTVHLTTEIPEDHTVSLKLPDDFPSGPVELFVVMVSPEEKRKSTFADLLNSEIVGMWADRTDIEDSSEFALKLREQAWKRAE